MGTKKKAHRKSKAALAASAVAGTVAATAAYRRHQARSATAPTPGQDAGPDGGAGATQPL
jgi:hypothetical protein